MKLGFDIVCIDYGPRGYLYSVQFHDRNETEYERFCNNPACRARNDELTDLEARLTLMVERHGFQKTMFGTAKYPAGIGKLTRGELRIYCYLLDTIAIVLGGGGRKRQTVRKLKDDPILADAYERIRYVRRRVEHRLNHDKKLVLTPFDGLIGDLNFLPKDKYGTFPS